MNKKASRRSFWIDPRTKLFMLLMSVLSAAMAPSLEYECILILLIAGYGMVCGKIRYSLMMTAIYGIIYYLTSAVLQLQGGIQVMLIAFFSLVHKVYPCGVLSGILLSTTRIGEFLTAMNHSHVSKKVVIPIAVMLRYAPTIREDWRSIKDAMRMRDVSPSLKSFITQPAMTLESVYVPLMMAASKTSDELTIAAVTRGIENPKTRTSLVSIGFGISDVICSLLFLSVFIAGQLCKGVFL